MELNRRSVLLAAGMGGGAGLLAGCSSNDQSPEQSSYPSLYDLSKPKDNLDAFVKILADLDGVPVWYTAKGIIYLIREGEMPTPFLGVQGLRYQRLERTENGFIHHTRDWGNYRDLKTNEILTEFSNPITGKALPVRQLLAPYYKWEVTPETGQYMEGYEGEAWLINRPFRLPYVQEGNDLTMTLPLLVKYSSGVGGGEWMHLMTDIDEINNPTLSQTSTKLSWIGHSPVMSWMGSADIKGRTLWQSTGRKHRTLETVPAQMLIDFNRFYPGSTDEPETYVKPV